MSSSDNTLMARKVEGTDLVVELRYLPLMDMVGVALVEPDGTGQWKTCEKHEALDVYHHPFAYGFKLGNA